MDMRDVAKFISENKDKIVICSPGCTFDVNEVIFCVRDEGMIIKVNLVIDKYTAKSSGGSF